MLMVQLALEFGIGQDRTNSENAAALMDHRSQVGLIMAGAIMSVLAEYQLVVHIQGR